MRKSYKFLVSVVVVLVCSFHSAAQSDTEYKDVLLDGKPAKLNVATGEIILVDLNSKKEGIDQKTSSNLKVKKAADSITSDYHIVKEGEGLFDISRQYKVSMTQLKLANSLETTLINAGEKLRIKNFKEPVSTYIQIEKNSPTEIAADEEVINFHTVKKDETLFSLAKHYQLSLEELKRLNNLNSNLIKVGQKLRVSTIDTKNDTNVASVWVVTEGDTLFSIAKKTGTSVEAIKTLNGLSSNLLNIGQKLRLK